jgi:hypothetical protein
LEKIMKHRWMLFVAVGAAALVSPSLFAQVIGGGRDASLTQQAEARAQEGARKDELANAILAARQTAAGRDLGARRDSMKQSLLSMSVEGLEAFLNAGGLGDIESAVRGTVGPSALGDTAKDLVFTPVPPCRVVDTRFAAAGILAASSTRSFLVRSAGGFATQGGSATDCLIPASATSVEMNFVAVNATGPGDLRAYAFGGAVPGSSVINYAAVAGLNIANGIAQPVCDPAGATPCTSDVSILTEASNTHLIIDVVGYYRSPLGLSSVKRAEFSFVSVPGTNAAVPLAAVTFTPARTGNVLVTATGYCNIDPTGVEHGVGVGLSANPNSGTVSRTAYMRVQVASPAGLHQFPWAITDYQAVTANVAATVTLRAQQYFGTAGNNEDCSGTLLVSQEFLAN